MRRVALTTAGIALVFGGIAVATDYVTLKGEWTVYTADCEQGVWQGIRCTGNLVAGQRYRFRTLKAHNEVIFWVSGSSEPSGKFTDCVVANGRNWSCKPGPDSGRSITHQMVKGHPVQEPGGVTRTFHCISKLRWWLLKYGIPTGSSAGV